MTGQKPISHSVGDAGRVDTGAKKAFAAVSDPHRGREMCAEHCGIPLGMGYVLFEQVAWNAAMPPKFWRTTNSDDPRQPPGAPFDGDARAIRDAADKQEALAMSNHPALQAGRAVVITGAASGIGLAAARRFAALGLRICLADLSEEALQAAAAEVAACSPKGQSDVLTVATDVSRLDSVQALRDAVYDGFGEVAVLMNNAGTAPGGGPWDNIERWRRVLEVNLWGAINGVQTFVPRCWNSRRPAPSSTRGPSRGSPAHRVIRPTTSARLG